MGVSVTSAGTGGGGIAVNTSFSDFNGRADEPFLMGQTWYTVNQGDSQGTGLQESSVLNVAAGDLVMGDLGINAGNISIVCFPQTVYPPLILTHSQFSQMRLVNGTNNFIATGPCVFANGNDGNGYALRTLNNAGARQVAIVRGLRLGLITAITAFVNVAYGDTLRLEIRPVISGGVNVSNDLVVLQNTTTTLFSINDNSALRPTSGMYGIAFMGAVNATDTWDTYRGGLL